MFLVKMIGLLLLMVGKSSTINIDLPNVSGLLTPIPNENSGATLVAQNRALDLALIAIDVISHQFHVLILILTMLKAVHFGIGWRPGLSTPDKDSAARRWFC